ncbi:MAG: TlpA family protein disulfide reductase [Azospira oryzae]|uniref:TlpA family protein disulfide reductase n=1 Tax=Pelomicrobium methylotrophicum TaxID=2602750 RepID=A0A5C7EU21_9PROT|nr:TlpA disulfide reductase family protein [Pelomicrobium methylotrophicum]PZP51944.1 MAG: TlpA family protein disulfide reductase [Azospira oryzae]PZP76212.1 MAG: TlpA family protein disulfide reductase [Azospira oryzae]TXF10817.1 TlpA family protein disulfide reductase [Pelomicrobium methylotrophicum]
MSRARQGLIAAVVAVLALVAGFALRHLSAVDSGGEAAGEALFDASFEDLNGQRVSLSRFRGQVVVVNFWATWCTPCREEIPEFVELQEEFRDQGVVFVGIAVDRREPVAAFSREFGINYPVLIGSLEAMELARKVGNRMQALPFTVVLGRDGQAAKVHLGKLSRDTLEPLLRKLV